MSQNISNYANPTKNIKETLEVLFEKEKMAKGNFFYSPLLASLSNGGSPHKSRIVIDSGEEMTTATPIYGFSILPDSITRTEVAGKFLNNLLLNEILLKDPTREIENFFIRILKENHLRISEFVYDDPAKNVILENNFYKKYVELPDESVIYLENEIYQVAESMFCPGDYGSEGDSFQEIIARCIQVNFIKFLIQFI